MHVCVHVFVCVGKDHITWYDYSYTFEFCSYDNCTFVKLKNHNSKVHRKVLYLFNYCNSLDILEFFRFFLIVSFVSCFILKVLS